MPALNVQRKRIVFISLLLVLPLIVLFMIMMMGERVPLEINQKGNTFTGAVVGIQPIEEDVIAPSPSQPIGQKEEQSSSIGISDIGLSATVNSCGTITADAEIGNNLTADRTCLIIGASHIVINCQGNRINYSTSGLVGYAINNTDGYDNVTIKNCDIRSGNSSTRGVGSRYGIVSYNASNITLLNNTVATFGTSSYPIYFYNSTNVNVTFNTLSNTGNGAHGILLKNTNNSILQGNNITTTNAAGGIRLELTSGNNNIVLNTINPDSNGIATATSSGNNNISFNNISMGSGATSVAGISLGTSNNIAYANNVTVVGSSTRGITVGGSNNTVSTNKILIGSFGTDGVNLGGDDTDNTIVYNDINTSNSNAEGVSVATTGNPSKRVNISFNNITTSGANAEGIAASDGSVNITIHRNNILTTGSGGHGIHMADVTNANITSNNITTKSSQGIRLAGTTKNAFLYNNNISDSPAFEIFDSTGRTRNSTLVYENSFGEIRWVNNGSGTFLGNLTVNVTNDLGLGLHRNIFIGNNSVAVNTSAFDLSNSQINSTANLTLYNLPFRNVTLVRMLLNYTTNTTEIIDWGENCVGISCEMLNYSSLTGMFVFNTSSFSSFAAQMDIIAPNVTITAPANGTALRTGFQPFNATIRDSYSTVDAVYFSILNDTNALNYTDVSNNSATWGVLINVSTLAEEFHTATVYANDSLGNLNNTVNVTFIVDRSAPNVSILFPTDGVNLSTGNRTFNATIIDTLLSLSAVTFSIRNDTSSVNFTPGNLSGIWNASVNLSALAEEYHVLIIYANDSAGNMNSSVNVTFIVDRTGPSISIITANYTNTTDTTPTIQFNLSENVFRNASCSVYVNGQLNGTNLTTGNATTTEFTFSTISSGVYPYLVNCTDGSGNIGTSTNMSLVVDVSGPLVTITTPQNRSNFTNGFQSFNATVFEELTNVQTVYFSIRNDSTPVNYTTTSNNSGTWGVLINVSSFVEEEHLAIVYANDTLGNLNSSQNISFTVDRRAPSVTIEFPRDQANLTMGNVDFNASVLDTLLDVQNVYFSISNSTTGYVNYTSTNLSGMWRSIINVSSLAEEYHTAYVYANDSAGNLNSSVNISFAVDRTSPTVTIININRTNTTDTTPDIQFNVTDNVFKNSTCRAYVNGQLNYTNTTTLNATTTNVTFSSLASGEYTYLVNCTDGSGNTGTSVNTTLTIDAIAPAVNITVPVNNSNFTNNNQNFNASVVDSLIPVDTVIFSFDNATGTGFNVTATNQSGMFGVAYNVSELANGRHVFIVVANDTLNNTNSTQNITFIVDRIAPFVNITTPLTNSNFSAGSQNFNATILDDFLDVQSVYFSMSNASGSVNYTAANASGLWGAVVNLSALAEESHVVIVYANDSVGNLNSSVNISFIVDWSAPQVNITAPRNNSNFTNGIQNFNSTVTDSLLFVDTVIFSFDNATGAGFNVTPTNQSGVWGVAYNVSLLASGRHVFIVIANDTLNNTNSTQNITFMVDRIAPTVNITTPRDKSNFSVGNQPFNASVIEETLDVQTVFFSMSNSTSGYVNYTAANQSGIWGVLVNVSALEEEYHFAFVYANDSAGNLNNSANISFAIDRTTPTVTIISINRTNTTDTTPDIQFNVTDNVFKNATCRAYVNGQLNYTNTTTFNATTTNVTFSPLTEGYYTYVINCTDGSGNTGTSFNNTITIDTTAPAVNITKPLFSSNFSRGNLSLNATVDDATLPVHTVFFSIQNGSDYLNYTATNNSGIWNASVNVSSLIEGSHLIIAYANDTVGNLNTTVNTTFTVDYSGPNVTIDVPIPRRTFTTGNEDVNATVLDRFVDVSFVYFNVSNGTEYLTYVATNVSGLWGAEVNVSNLAEEAHTLTVYANDTLGNLNSSESVTFTVDRSVPAAEAPKGGGGGGGGGCPRGTALQNGICVPVELPSPPECAEKKDCSGEKFCVNQQCVKLFDLKTVEIQSPAQAGGFFNFTYLLKGMANISGDVRIKFWLEKDGEQLTSGSDILFIGNHEEKVESAQMFVPTTTQAGVYMFYLELKFEKYVIQSYRSVELAGGVMVGPPVEGLVTREEEPERGALAGQAVRTGMELLRDYSAYWIAAVLTLSALGVLMYVISTRKPAPKNIDNLEVWVRQMMALHATKEQFDAVIAKQEYWTREDVQRAMARVHAKQTLREMYHFSDDRLRDVTQFILSQRQQGRKKREVVRQLVQQGLGESMVETLVRTYY